MKRAADNVAEQAKKKVAAALKEAAPLVKGRFEQFASANLGFINAGLYQEGIAVRTTDENGGSLAVVLEGAVPNALETGYNAFDIKPGLLASGSAKQGKNGETYVDVPLGLTADMVPPSIKGMLTKKEKAADAANKAAGMSDSLRSLAAQRTEFKEKGIYRQGGEHKEIKRVSTRSDPSSWIHPGFRGIRAAERLKDEVFDLVMRVVRSHLRSGK